MSFCRQKKLGTYRVGLPKYLREVANIQVRLLQKCHYLEVQRLPKVDTAMRHNLPLLPLPPLPPDYYLLRQVPTWNQRLMMMWEQRVRDGGAWLLWLLGAGLAIAYLGKLQQVNLDYGLVKMGFDLLQRQRPLLLQKQQRWHLRGNNLLFWAQF